jgi:hypothetical protein
MVHIGISPILDPISEVSSFASRITPDKGSVLIARGDGVDNMFLDSVCEFLNLDAEHVSIDNEIFPLLNAVRPVAVIADLIGKTQDGFHIMKLAAAYDRDLPVLLLTDGDPSLLGAVDAVREIWGLTRVATLTGDRDVGSLVDFLCHAARDTGAARMIRV